MRVAIERQGAEGGGGDEECLHDARLVNTRKIEDSEIPPGRHRPRRSSGQPRRSSCGRGTTGRTPPQAAQSITTQRRGEPKMATPKSQHLAVGQRRHAADGSVVVASMIMASAATPVITQPEPHQLYTLSM